MGQRTFSLSTVRYSGLSSGGQVAIRHHTDGLTVNLGLSDELLQRLTSSQAEPYLAACKELFLNIWGKSNVPLGILYISGCVY